MFRGRKVTFEEDHPAATAHLKGSGEARGKGFPLEASHQELTADGGHGKL